MLLRLVIHTSCIVLYAFQVFTCFSLFSHNCCHCFCFSSLIPAFDRRLRLRYRPIHPQLQSHIPSRSHSYSTCCPRSKGVEGELFDKSIIVSHIINHVIRQLILFRNKTEKTKKTHGK